VLMSQSVTKLPVSEWVHEGAPPAAQAGDAAVVGIGKEGTTDVRQLFAPIRPGLKQVEAKLKAVDSSLFGPLANAFVSLIGSGGKRLRPALALLAANVSGEVSGEAAVSWQSRPDYNRVIALAASIEMLHTATLVHDDVIDGALLRRGAPTLNATWSGGSTVLAGNYMFGTAARFSAETQTMRVIDLFSATLHTIVDGELRQLQDRYNYGQDKTNYYDRIYAKTASLFCAATEGAAVLAGLPEERVQDLRDYGYNLGMAFQIVDDILDFTGDDSTLGKPAGSDLRQGTLTLPFFYFVQLQSDPHALFARLHAAQLHADQGDTAVWNAEINRLVSELRSSGAVEAARSEARVFLSRAVHNLSALPDNVYRRSLQGLCSFVVQRTN
jgi:geranylgeranyl pyrophosphate synthase